MEERLRLALKIEQNPDKFRVVEAKKSGSPRSAAGRTPPRLEAERGRRGTVDSAKSVDDQNTGRPGDAYAGDRDSSVLIDEKMEVPSNIQQ